MSSLEIFSQSESIASPYAQSLNLGYAANCRYTTQGPARIVTFSETVWSVWRGHISGLPVLELQTARREGQPLQTPTPAASQRTEEIFVSDFAYIPTQPTR